MKIEKLPSGSYRVRKMYKGKSYSLTFNYKPTQKEVIQAMSEALDKSQKDSSRKTFYDAAVEYCEMKRNVLSPSTLTGYQSTIRNISNKFKSLALNEISSVDIQKEINDYAATHSPKTVRNTHGFISAVLKTFRPNMNVSTTLPQKRKNEQYIPSDEDVRRILERAKGTKYEIPLILATFGLRRSEICGLSIDDLKGNMLSIRNVMVEDGYGNFIIKDVPKTTAGAREIFIPDYLVELIQKEGKIYDGSPGQIYENLCKYQKELGIPHFKLHALRHYYASMSHSLGIPDSYIMQAGGWKSDNTLKLVYRHAMDSKQEEMQKIAATHISKLLDCDNS